jgi:hypothetical protein
MIAGIIHIGFMADKTFLLEYFFVACEALRKCISRHSLLSAVWRTPAASLQQANLRPAIQGESVLSI